VNTTRTLRREEMSVDQHVGLFEGGDGQRLHGVIERLDRYGAHIWVSDDRHGKTLAKRDRGFLARLTYEQAEDGAMWSEPVITEDLAARPTGHDLLDYWGWARKTTSVAHATATSYLQSARTILGQLPGGLATDIETLDVEAAISAYTVANRGLRAPSTIAQYASGFRNAVAGFLRQRGTDQPGTRRTRTTLGDGRAVTVITPAELPAPARRTTAPGEAGEHPRDAR